MGLYRKDLLKAPHGSLFNNDLSKWPKQNTFDPQKWPDETLTGQKLVLSRLMHFALFPSLLQHVPLPNSNVARARARDHS